MKIETDVEKYLVNRVKEEGGRALKWISPGNDGVPDRIIILPNRFICFAETKRPKGGKLRATQKLFGIWLAQMGFSVFILKNTKEVDEFIRLTRLIRLNTLGNFVFSPVKFFEDGGFYEFSGDCVVRIDAK